MIMEQQVAIYWHVIVFPGLVDAEIMPIDGIALAVLVVMAGPRLVLHVVHTGNVVRQIGEDLEQYVTLLVQPAVIIPSISRSSCSRQAIFFLQFMQIALFCLTTG
jgi:hypothetical protein